MPELLTPGVFIQEVDFGPNPIEGVSTSTAGFAGEAERGPTSGPPVLVTSFADFQRTFGGFVKDKPLAYAVRGFFDNGGKRAYIARVVGSGGGKASKSFLPNGHKVRILAVAGDKLTLSSVVGLDTKPGGVNGTLRIYKSSDGSLVGSALDVSAVNGATGVVTVDSGTPLPSGIGPSTHFAAITPIPSPLETDSVIDLTARDDGAFGNRISVLVEAQFINSTPIYAQQSDNKHFVLGAVDFLKPGAKVQLETASGDKRELGTIEAIDPGTRTIQLDTAVAQTYVGSTQGKLFLIGWRLTVFFDGAVVERLEGLSSVLDGSDKAAELKAEVAARSAWVQVTDATLSPLDNLFPSLSLAQPVLLSGGPASDPDATDTNFVGTEEPRTGLKALEAQKGINLIAAPGRTGTAVVGELIAQAERRMDRFAVFESDSDSDTVTEVLAERAKYNSRYAAMYHPWIKALDPLSKTEIDVPPSGHILGAYARTDNDRGVFKAPANVTLRGITGFSRVVPDGEQDILNPAGVNVLRNYEGLGNVIWGARTISAEGLWKYVSVRRLFIFIEQSLVKGTRYAVFEPNDLRLWARLRDSVKNFLTTQWRAGALFGSKPEEAFFVRVDETTTTQDDRDNGRVNIVIGIAPVKPAEFIVFQIGQAPSSVIISEQGS